MILYCLAFLALIFSPSWGFNSLLCKTFICALLLLLIPDLKPITLTPARKLFLVFAAWFAVCCVFSESPAISIHGFYLRFEGFISYAVLGSLAFIYWMKSSELTMLRTLLVFSLILIPVLHVFYEMSVMPLVALGAFAAVSAVLLYVADPSLIIFAVPALLLANSRSALVAVVVGISCSYIFEKRNVFKSKVLWVSAALFCAVLPFTELSQKLKALEVTGKGARAHWMLEASREASHLPLTGIGPDMIWKKLTPASAEFRQMEKDLVSIPDRTHNIAFDLILQTGWIGYFLSLLCFGLAVGLAVKFPTRRNVASLCALVAYAAFASINPPGLCATAIAITCFLGMKGEKCV